MVKKVLKVSHNSIFSRLIFFKSYWEFTGGISTQGRWMESLQSTSVLLFIGLTSFQSSLFERFVFFLRLFKALFVNFQRLLFSNILFFYFSEKAFLFDFLNFVASSNLFKNLNFCWIYFYNHGGRLQKHFRLVIFSPIFGFPLFKANREILAST